MKFFESDLKWQDSEPHKKQGIFEIEDGAFLRMNNTRNCSREVPEYFVSEIFWWYSGAPQRARGGSLQMDFFESFATEFHRVKFEETKS